MKSLLFFITACALTTSAFATPDEMEYIRCRALTPNGGIIYGDFEPIRGSVEASAQQAYRNFMVTRCGGPLGDRCARPVKCNGYDRFQNDLGQVLEQ